MSPIVSKLTLGTLLSLGIGGPGAYLVMDNLTPKTIKDQMDKDGIKLLDKEKYQEKVDKQQSDSNLKQFIQKHKDPSEETIKKEDLEVACQAFSEKYVSEINYEEFKKYCTDETT